MIILVLSNTTAFEKGQDSAYPCREPQKIMTTSVSLMLVICVLVNIRDSVSHFA